MEDFKNRFFVFIGEDRPKATKDGTITVKTFCPKADERVTLTIEVDYMCRYKHSTEMMGNTVYHGNAYRCLITLHPRGADADFVRLLNRI